MRRIAFLLTAAGFLLTACGGKGSGQAPEIIEAMKISTDAVFLVETSAASAETAAQTDVQDDPAEMEKYPMKLELTTDGFWRKGSYFSKRFDGTLEVLARADAGLSDAYIEQCADAAENLSDDMMNEICGAAKRYALAFIGEYMEDLDEDFSFEDEGLPEITEDTPAGEMIDYFTIGEVIADQPKGDCQQYFRLSGSCDWETEHGFEAAFQNGKLVYLGSFDDVTPSRLDYFINGKGREFNYALEGE